MTANGVAAWKDLDGDGIATATLNSGGGSPDANSVTTGTIVDGAIIDADINAAAAIAVSKLAAGTATYVLTSTSGTAVWSAPASGAPSGAAGGSLTGTYPNPTIATIPSGATATTQSAADGSTKVATTAYVDTAGALKANLAGPTFTGSPVLPTGTTGVTQSAADGSTKLATTAYVDTAGALKANLAGPTFTGTPTLPTGTIGTTQSTQDSSTKLATTAFVAAQAERAFVTTKSGVIGATETDSADYIFIVPFNATLLRMKATVKTAVSGAMTVQLRTAAATITNTITWGNVSGFVCTYSSGNYVAVIDPANVNVSEGDILGISCGTGSGANLLVEVVAIPR